MDYSTEDIRALLNESPLSEDQKRQLILQGLELSANIALSQTRGAANGEFLRILLDLFKMLLPILLDLLKPRS